jgi:hypothetical protein
VAAGGGRLVGFAAAETEAGAGPGKETGWLEARPWRRLTHDPAEMATC